MNTLEVVNLKIWDSSTNKMIIPNSSFHVKQGSCLAIVGESGSGKSVTCRAIMRLNKGGIRQTGDILFKGENLTELPEKEMRKKRGKNLCMILQNGMRAFNPSCVVGVHLKGTLVEHFGWSHDEITAKMKNAMESVMLKNPIEVMNKYPHQLSGGMLQRVMIALAIVLEPDIIIADEPTTALDTISQFEVVEQFIQLRARMGCSMIFISHDLGVVKKIADEVLVMKDGKIVERGTTQAIFSKAQHEHTRYLVSTKLALNHHFRRIMGGVIVAER
ncbi:staphylopine uptake ABC transporter ATP-binding protein CntD [Aneurinibacillus migulanus]|uniref:Nickel transport system ATP-binding protein n=1 Tax=Aneurinibacillus migulanus TaxID=47500 RepID=A0A0D1VWN9_ANEMI|nr:ABC transporter ATP-binding protein [Aneurinibacillus migulanus]KIV50640.1 peptide ABC transporter ATP-binding protein [Aneurinibacillus migulanus]KON97451.1 peptide ABC transporter ATP-binding protein [Aneurinibacillus migulanus]MED0896120.1 ABC transporter ATP-binding protein [Aneurinibacillus migulanus]MED1618548.1 ABC transporter ATP-binding protein [Aneurinibacillus migulanus]SDK50181.1 nickel transport system ATP-binding protein [Aneurinibacillus migulanus]